MSTSLRRPSLIFGAAYTPNIRNYFQVIQTYADAIGDLQLQI
jgi:hypothetical protein